jgi:predicted ATP-grasp superfamily ATP-dependent carboligase
VKVVVTDGAERAALAATRSLGRCGAAHVVSDDGASLAGRSRWASADHAVGSPLEDAEGFRSRVSAVAERIGADAILPVSDAATQALLCERERLPAVLVAPEASAYRTLSDKGAMAERARAHGIEIPPGGLARSLEEAVALSDSLDWPTVVKPVSSVHSDASGASCKVGVERVSGPDALREVWRRTVGADGALIQQVVPGRGEGIFLLRWRGETLAAFAHRRLREKPPEGGMSVLRESIPLPTRLLGQVEALLDETGFEGAAMAEFRSDGQHAWLMEFNARFWGSLQLVIDAGIDFPALLVRTFLGEVPDGPTEYRVGTRLRWLLGDLDHAIALARGGVDSRGRSGLGAALRVVFGSNGSGTRWEVLRGDDLRPFLHELGRWLRRVD